MADKKKKPTLALVISVGPKMKTKPTDAATPDMKKYGSMPMKKAFGMLKQNFKISNLPPHIRARNLPDMSPQRFIDEDLHRVGAKNYTRDFMPGPSRYDDEGFPEYDGEDLGPPYGKPEFGDEEARQAEMEDAERATIMAEGMSEMQKPRTAPRPGDPRFADPNKPRPRMPRDVFGKAWDMLKGERGGMPRNFKRTRIPPKPMRQVAPEPEAKPEIPTPQKVAAAKQQFDFINNIRRKRGEPPISIDEHLQQAGLTLEDYDREYHPEALE